MPHEPSPFRVEVRSALRGVGPAGAHLAGLDPQAQLELRERCRRRVPAEPFEITAVAWAARGLA